MTHRDNAEVVWFLATRMSLLASAETTGGAFGLIEGVLPPGFSPPLHVHSREDEPMYVIEGQVTFQVGDQRFEAGPGRSCSCPKMSPIRSWWKGDAPARVLELALPGGFERFHIEGGRPAEGPGLPAPAPPDIVMLDQLAARYGTRHIGPPIEHRFPVDPGWMGAAPGPKLLENIETL
jgi:quercetin dioxygenase-like cupin family protein